MTAPTDPTPDPLREEPPADHFCDLVLNGGVASGVVYPWALLELARHYRFKNIGGNSVGAMAAAMAAAAEYGRCNGSENAFEPLRHFPLKLAEEEGGQTKMLRLFQPSRPVRRLFQLFLAVVRWGSPEPDPAAAREPAPASPAAQRRRLDAWAMVCAALTIYGFWPSLAVTLALAAGAVGLARGASSAVLVTLAQLSLLSAVLVALLACACRFRRDLQALTGNGYGLCTGLGQIAGEEGLVEWLHKGIQLSAGRDREDPPLTFADLWAAPRFGRAGPAPLPGGLQPREPGIDLQMFCSNVTQGRPVRLPLNDSGTRLFYHPEDWKRYFPPAVMVALERASRPYAPASRSDPDPADPDRPPSAEQAALMRALRELPSGGMPIVVAARLSLCFPVLFSCVPVYAVDYESPGDRGAARQLRACLLSDGGLCTNFPIHLFDAAHPRWPTFAFLLDNRLQKFEQQALWLPETHLEGRGDNWQRFVPGAEDDGAPDRSLLERLLGVAGGMLLTMKDWNDRMTGRLPQVRNRIIRLALQPGEGQLNLAMPRQTILRMAHEYGTQSGRRLVERFAPEGNEVKRAWREHLYVRSMIELRALRSHLRGYTSAVQAGGSTLPLREVLDRATRERALAEREKRPDPGGAALAAAQRQALDRALRAVQALEAELSACESQFGPYRPVAEPELRLRPPL